MRGLFSGLQPALLGTAVSQGVYFYFYSLLRELAVARKHAAAGTSSLQRSREQELPIGTAPFVLMGSKMHPQRQAISRALHVVSHAALSNCS